MVGAGRSWSGRLGALKNSKDLTKSERESEVNAMVTANGRRRMGSIFLVKRTPRSKALSDSCTFFEEHFQLGA